MLTLAFNLQFADLYQHDGLKEVDAAFLRWLGGADPDLAARLVSARGTGPRLEAKQESQLLVDLAPHVDDFMGALFGIRAEIAALAQQHHALAPLYEVKRQFVQRRVVRAYDPDAVLSIDGAATQALDDCGRAPGLRR